MFRAPFVYPLPHVYHCIAHFGLPSCLPCCFPVPPQLLVAGGAMYVEVFNRGVIPLAYSIRKRNSRTGLPSTYYDGIYLLVTYFTKPDSLSTLQQRLNADDDVIRSTSFKVRPRKAF